ncbi:MAG: hypothetical protein OEM49_08595 [Myxococcales bacterium]|nr:hypothetical protein [Myxococcales bacterium]MDH5565290.1 hypothetical protein [Myxococcales bacterium]
MGSFPDVAALAPHQGPMRLLGAVLTHSPAETICSVDLEGSGLFRGADGSVPAFVALEYMAQCAAVHAGLAARAGWRAPEAALLLGSRRLRLAVDRFPAGQRLRVSARHQRGESGLVLFECAVRDEASGRTLAQGRLSLYTVAPGDSLEELPS